MDLVKITKFLKQYGFIILGIIVLIFILSFFIGEKPYQNTINKNIAFSKIGPISGSIPREKLFTTQSFSNTIFSTNVNIATGNITYFKYYKNTNSYKEYFMKSPNNYTGKTYNNPIYLGYYLSYDIYNIPYPQNQSSLVNYKAYLIEHFYAIPAFLYSNDNSMQAYLANNYAKFLLASPSLENIKILKYIQNKEYIVEYKYVLTLDSGNGGVNQYTRNMSVTLKKYNNQWKIKTLKL
jgi:hypothetical protein